MYEMYAVQDSPSLVGSNLHLIQINVTGQRDIRVPADKSHYSVQYSMHVC